MEEHDATKDTQTSQDYTGYTYTSWDHADNWDDADWWTNDRSTHLWDDPACERAARQLVLPQSAQEQYKTTQGGSISIVGGLSMNVMKVQDGTRTR